jgi:TRAP transporter TAXI family solute receptor
VNQILKFAAISTTVLTLAGAANAEERLKMAVTDPGSSNYLVMTTIAQIVNEHVPGIKISVDATGAATKHMVEVAEGKKDLSMTSPTIYQFMKEGRAMYSKLPRASELSKNLGLITWFPYGTYHVVVYADSNIKELKDIKGKKVFLGPPGGGAWNTANSWVSAVTGYKAGVDYKNVKASWGAAIQAFNDRQIDVYINGGIPPYPQIEQLALTSKIRLLGLTKDQVAKATEKMLAPAKALGRDLGVIAAGTYGDGVVNKEDVYSVGSTVGLTARMDLPEETVYKITKAFWEHLPEAQKTAPFLKAISLDQLAKATNMPLHPGALRYYKEIGVKLPKEMQ